MDPEIRVKVKIIGGESGLPYYASAGAAGLDLAACLPAPVLVGPGARVNIPTGLAIELPSAFYVGLVFPRSGLASKHGIGLANGVGVIDSDYTGEIICPVHNHGQAEFTINPGDRIAQLVFLPIARAILEPVDQLTTTARGEGGFGSTGTAQPGK